MKKTKTYWNSLRVLTSFIIKTNFEHKKNKTGKVDWEEIDQTVYEISQTFNIPIADIAVDLDSLIKPANQ